MNSRDFVRLTSLFVQESPAIDYLLSLLAVMQGAHTSLRDLISAAVRAKGGSNQVQTAHSSLVAAIDSFSDAIKRDFDTRKVWAGVKVLTARAMTLRGETFAKEVGENILVQLSAFSATYEEFVKAYDVPTTLL